MLAEAPGAFVMLFQPAVQFDVRRINIRPRRRRKKTPAISGGQRFPTVKVTVWIFRVRHMVSISPNFALRKSKCQNASDIRRGVAWLILILVLRSFNKAANKQFICQHFYSTCTKSKFSSPKPASLPNQPNLPARSSVRFSWFFLMRFSKLLILNIL